MILKVEDRYIDTREIRLITKVGSDLTSSSFFVYFKGVEKYFEIALNFNVAKINEGLRNLPENQLKQKVKEIVNQLKEELGTAWKNERHDTDNLIFKFPKVPSQNPEAKPKTISELK